jgi:hypothetical protein
MPANCATNSSFYGTTSNFRQKTGRPVGTPARLDRWANSQWLAGGGDVLTRQWDRRAAPPDKKKYLLKDVSPINLVQSPATRLQPPGTALGTLATALALGAAGKGSRCRARWRAFQSRLVVEPDLTPVMGYSRTKTAGRVEGMPADNLGACPSNRCSNPSESDSSVDYEQALSPLEYRSDAASAAECAGLRAQGPRLAVYRWAGAGERALFVAAHC